MKTILTDIIPTTARQAFKILDSLLTDEEKLTALTKTRSDFACDEHFCLGAWIRNNWIFGPEMESEEEADRRDACLEMLTATQKGDLIIVEPDWISSQFLGRYYDHLKRTAKL